jgi:ethanolamine utilization protein EutA
MHKKGVIYLKEKILSVGIDIGTSTSQIVISRLTLENLASDFTVPRIEISKKEIIYRSEIIFTPLKPSNPQEIEIEPLKKFIEQEYQKAGIRADDIQTGAVIITGETARKSNAERVLKSLSHLAGDFVVATAGPDLESVIAGKGAGTQRLSKEKGNRAVNLDIGGGTSNLACFNNNVLESTGCFDIGGRLIKIDKSSQIVSYIAPKVEKFISDKKLNLKVGAKGVIEEIQLLTDEFARILAHSIGIGEKPEYFDLFVDNHSIKLLGKIPYVTFSGGVAECLEEELPADIFRYGDIGLILGRSIRKSRIFTEKTVVRSLETIQATVVGAGSHLTEVSGSTISYRTDNLPMQNIPVIHLENVQEAIHDGTLAEQIREKLNWFEYTDYDGAVAIAYDGWKNPLFSEVQALAEAFRAGLQSKIDKGQVLVLISWQDMGKSVGQSLYSLLPRAYPYISLDTIQADSGDYIDIGAPVASGNVLPVVVKTLVFE